MKFIIIELFPQNNFCELVLTGEELEGSSFVYSFDFVYFPDHIYNLGFFDGGNVGLLVDRHYLWVLSDFNFKLLRLIFFHFDDAPTEEIFLIVLKSSTVEGSLFTKENSLDRCIITINQSNYHEGFMLIDFIRFSGNFSP